MLVDFSCSSPSHRRLVLYNVRSHTFVIGGNCFLHKFLSHGPQAAFLMNAVKVTFCGRHYESFPATHSSVQPSKYFNSVNSIFLCSGNILQYSLNIELLHAKSDYAVSKIHHVITNNRLASRAVWLCISCFHLSCRNSLSQAQCIVLRGPDVLKVLHSSCNETRRCFSQRINYIFFRTNSQF